MVSCEDSYMEEFASIYNVCVRMCVCERERLLAQGIKVILIAAYQTRNAIPRLEEMSLCLPSNLRGSAIHRTCRGFSGMNQVREKTFDVVRVLSLWENISSASG